MAYDTEDTNPNGEEMLSPEDTKRIYAAMGGLAEALGEEAPEDAEAATSIAEAAMAKLNEIAADATYRKQAEASIRRDIAAKQQVRSRRTVATTGELTERERVMCAEMNCSPEVYRQLRDAARAAKKGRAL